MRDTTKPIPVKTRQHRRKAIFTVIGQLEAILDAELDYRDNIPIKPQNANMYSAASQAVSALENALQSLYEAY